MALPATGTATRDGSCCCGGGGATCCDLCDPPDELCVTFGTGDVGLFTGLPDTGDCAPAGFTEAASGTFANWFDGQTFTLTRTACSWAGSAASVTIGGLTYTRVVTVELYQDGGTCRFRVTAEQYNPSGMSAYGHTFSTTTAVGYAYACGADPEVGETDCLPVGFSGSMYGSYANGSFAHAAYTGGFTLDVCAGPMMAAATAPDPPCRWRSAELTGGERSALALDHRKAWYRCGKPDFPRLGLPVTDCRTCKAVDMRCSKAGCTGYEPADVDGRPDV